MKVTFTHNGKTRTGTATIEQISSYLTHLQNTGRSADLVVLEGEDAAAVFTRAAGANLANRPENAVDLLATDLAMARVVEDLFEALKTKGVLADGDLPADARERIADRKSLRGVQS